MLSCVYVSSPSNPKCSVTRRRSVARTVVQKNVAHARTDREGGGTQLVSSSFSCSSSSGTRLNRVERPLPVLNTCVLDGRLRRPSRWTSGIPTQRKERSQEQDPRLRAAARSNALSRPHRGIIVRPSQQLLPSPLSQPPTCCQWLRARHTTRRSSIAS